MGSRGFPCESSRDCLPCLLIQRTTCFVPGFRLQHDRRQCFAFGLVPQEHRAEAQRSDVGRVPLDDFDCAGRRHAATDENIDRPADDVPILRERTGVFRNQRADRTLAIFRDPLQQGPFVGGAGRRLGMRLVPNTHLGDRQGLEVLLDDRLGQPELQVLVHPLVHDFPADVVVVVRKMHERLGHDEPGRAEHLVMLHQFGQSLGGDFPGPIVGGRHAQRPRRRHGGELDIAGPDAQVACVLANAAALHGGPDHDGRKRHGRTRVDRRKDERLRAAAAGAGDADPLRIDVLSRTDPIQSADRVVGLKAHARLQPGLGLRTGIAPVLRRAHGRTQPGTVRQLQAVGHSHHVVDEDDAAHAGQLHTARLQRKAAADLKPLGAVGDRLTDRLLSRVLESPIGPMAVRTQYCGQPTAAAFGSVEVPRDEMSGITFQKDLFDGVAVAIDQSVHDRMGRRLCRHGPQAGGHSQLPMQPLGSHGPLLLALAWNEREIAVKVHDRTEAFVIRQLSLRQHAGRFSRGSRLGRQARKQKQRGEDHSRLRQASVHGHHSD